MDNQEKILISVVEDDKFLRELLIKKLKDEGFAVSFSVDGQQAFKEIKKKIPRLILLDIELPGLNGFEVLKQLKQDSQTKGIPVIILSNLGEEEHVKKGLSLGAEDYMVKAHFTPDEIVAKIKDIL